MHVYIYISRIIIYPHLVSSILIIHYNGMIEGFGTLLPCRSLAMASHVLPLGPIADDALELFTASSAWHVPRLWG